MADAAQIVRVLSYHGFTVRASDRGLIVRPHPGNDHLMTPTITKHRDTILDYVKDCQDRHVLPEIAAFQRTYAE